MARPLLSRRNRVPSYSALYRTPQISVATDRTTAVVQVYRAWALWACPACLCRDSRDRWVFAARLGTRGGIPDQRVGCRAAARGGSGTFRLARYDGALS